MNVQLWIYIGVFLLIVLPIYVIWRKKSYKGNFIHEIYLFLFLLSIILILYITVLPTFMMINRKIYILFENSNHHQNMIPFKTIKHLVYLIQHKIYLKYAYSNLLGNLFLFYPFALLYPCVKKSKFIEVFFVSLIFAISIEIIQSFQQRITDIDDVILNSIGAILGYLTYKLLKVLVCKKNQ